MKFMILLAEEGHFSKWESAEATHRDRVHDDFRAFSAAVAERGSIVAGEALDRPEAARTLRAAPAGAERVVVDGPYAETVEQVGGFYVIDVPDLDTAVEVAGLLPREYDLEVRPVVDVDLS